MAIKYHEILKKRIFNLHFKASQNINRDFLNLCFLAPTTGERRAEQIPNIFTLSHNIMPIGDIGLSRSTITSWASFDQTATCMLCSWSRSRSISGESVSLESGSSDEGASRYRPRPRGHVSSYIIYVAVQCFRRPYLVTVLMI